MYLHQQINGLFHLKGIGQMFNMKAIQQGRNFYHVRMWSFQDPSAVIHKHLFHSTW